MNEAEATRARIVALLKSKVQTWNSNKRFPEFHKGVASEVNVRFYISLQGVGMVQAYTTF